MTVFKITIRRSLKPE